MWKFLSPLEQEKFYPLGVIHEDDRPDLLNSKPYLEAMRKAKAAHDSYELFMEEITLPEQDPLEIYPRTTMRFAGSGGQGVVSMGEMFLHTVSAMGQEGVVTENYGPEARGGSAYSNLTVSKGPVHSILSNKLDYLVALTGEAFYTYRNNVLSAGHILVDSIAVPETYGDPRVLSLPLSDILAREVLPPKPGMGLNVLSLAVFSGLFDLAPYDQVEAAVMKGVGQKAPKMNQRALQEGFSLADRLKRFRKDLRGTGNKSGMEKQVV